MGLSERWVATRKGFKPRDVEEPIDYYWHRPLAGLLVAKIQHLPITPNQVTVASGVASLCSGIAIAAGAYDSPWWALLGGMLLFLSIILDCADGQLARVKGISSPIGRILDGTMDGVAPTAVFTGMALLLLARGYPPWLVWPAAVVSAASLVWHASQYDVAKNIHLHASRPDFSLGGNTLLTVDNMREMQEAFRARGETLNALLMGIWVVWTKPQVALLSPWLDAARTPKTEAERELFRALLGSTMQAQTWLGFGIHLFLLSVAALLAPLAPQAIFVAWGCMALPMNALALWVAFRRPRQERRFVSELAAMRATEDASKKPSEAV